MKFNFAIANVIFIFAFLNVWDFAVNGVIFNAMALGLIMFGVVTILWRVKSFKAVVLITLISLFEFVVTIIFIAEGLQLSGIGYSTKTIFWLPYLVMSGINTYWGLNIYTKTKKKTRLV